MYNQFNIPEEIRESLVKMNPSLLMIFPIGRKLLHPEERRKLIMRLTIRRILPGGTQEWRLFGKRHREDRPAVICHDGRMMWYVNNNVHRVDRPAIIYPDGKRIWYIDGKFVRTNYQWK